MRLRWYISTFIITLALLGTLCNEQTVGPNQEIVLEFLDTNIVSSDAQTTIAAVKTQLKDLGATNIKVTEFSGNGMLKITYYSNADVLLIKRILSKENNVELDFASNSHDENQSQWPSDKDTKIFNLDVYKIQDSNDSNTGLDGRLAIEIKSEIERFFNPVVDVFAVEIEDRERDRIIKVAFKLNRNIAIAINNTSHNIPEVRAGPQASENS
jgi:hypothetical protein